MSNFQTGFKLGQGIGEAMGPQQSPMVAQIVKQKIASDMQIQKEAIMTAAKGGFGVSDTGELAPIYDNAPDALKMVALESKWKGMTEAAQKVQDRTYNVLGKVTTLWDDIVKEKNPEIRKFRMNVLKRLMSEEEIGGAPNPGATIGRWMAESGFDLDKALQERQARKEAEKATAIVTFAKMMEAHDQGNSTEMFSAWAMLKAMDPEVVETLGDIDKPISEQRDRFMTHGQLAARERQDKLTTLAAEERIKSKYGDEFNRNLNRLVDLERQGKTDSTEYKWLTQRMQKQAASQGTILTQEDGKITFMQGDVGGLQSQLTGQQQLKQKEQLDRYETTMGFISEAIDNIEESPTRAGAWGSIRGFTQKLLGVAEDVAPEAIANTVRNSIRGLPGLSKSQKENLTEYFDPAIPENEILGNTIALELAKLRVTAGGGGIRALESAFKAAREDVALTGKFSSQEALTRLKKIYEEFKGERDKLAKRLKGKDGQSDVDALLDMYAPEE